MQQNINETPAYKKAAAAKIAQLAVASATAGRAVATPGTWALALWGQMAFEAGKYADGKPSRACVKMQGTLVQVDPASGKLLEAGSPLAAEGFELAYPGTTFRVEQLEPATAPTEAKSVQTRIYDALVPIASTAGNLVPIKHDFWFQNGVVLVATANGVKLCYPHDPAVEAGMVAFGPRVAGVTQARVTRTPEEAATMAAKILQPLTL